MRRRDEFLGSRGSMYLFVSTMGTQLIGGRVHRAFYELSRQTALRAPGVSRWPRPHDFQHGFAVSILTRWYQAGVALQYGVPRQYAAVTRTRISEMEDFGCAN